MDNIYYLGLSDSAEHKRLICGRTNDLRALLNHIYAGKSVALFGERRIGKTSTLYLIRDIINGAITQYQNELFDEALKQALPALPLHGGNQWHAVYLSCQGLHPVNLSTFFGRIIDELSGVISQKPKNIKKVPLSPNADISRHFQVLHTQLPEDQRVVILVDEVDALFDTPQEERKIIFNLLRDIMHACPKFCFVLAGAEQWYRDIKTRSSPLTNNITSYYLLTPEPTPIRMYLIGYLTRQLRNRQQEVEEVIVEWSGYKPYYVQAICSEITQICQGQEGASLPDRWEQDVEKRVIEQTKPIYAYVHPPLRTFSHAFSDTSVSVYLPASLEQDEAGTATVRVQNTTPSTVYTVTVILSSDDIDFREVTAIALHLLLCIRARPGIGSPDLLHDLQLPLRCFLSTSRSFKMVEPQWYRQLFKFPIGLYPYGSIG